jgi:hypothetical protein
MPNVFDYLKWRGDLRFEQDGFNEVDNLILATLSYMDFGGIVPGPASDAAVPLHKAAALVREMNKTRTAGPFLSRFPALLEKAVVTNRYRDVALSRYVNEVDEEKPNQFSALVFSLNDRAHYIAFRGTDDNLAGWKEDFLMGFKDVVLAQQQAADYVGTIVPRLRGDVTLGGHSKGGNLAVYAAASASDRIMKKIVAVYNNDGPGFQTSVIQSEGYKKILGRIQTFIPESSVIGMLLEHGESYRIVSSTEKGIMSHNSVTWEVCGNAFVHASELSKASRQLNQTLRSWMDQLSLPQREQFTEALFEIITASGAQTVTDLSKERLSLIDAMIRKLKTMDRESRKLLKDTVVMFFSIRQKIMRQSISGSLEALIAKKA